MPLTKTKQGIPKGWEKKRLDDYIEEGVIQLSRGNVISKKDIVANPGPNPIYSSSIQKGGLFGTYGDYMFDEELITWSVDGGGNFFYRPKHKFSVTNVSGIFRVDTNKFIYKFLAYLLEWEHRNFNFDYQTKAHPSVIRQLYFISRPPLPEQKKIAEILNAVDEEIQKTDEIIATTEKLKHGLMQQLFTRGIGHTKFKKTKLGDMPKKWDVISVGEIIEKVIDNRGKTPPLSADGHELIEVNAIDSKQKSPNYNNVTKFVSEETFNTWFRNGHPTKGDVLIPTVGTVGVAALMQEDRGCIAQNIVGLRVKKEVFAEYFYYLSISSLFVNQIYKVLMGAVQPSLKVPHMLGFMIPLPDAKEQRKIAEILSSVDEKISVNQKLKDKLTLLKKGLMQDLLSGKVRTRT